MEKFVTSTMKLRTPSGDRIHHHHPYAVGGISAATGSATTALHSTQQVGSVPSNVSDYSDLEFYSGPSSHDVVTWKNVGAHSMGVVGNPVHHTYGLPEAGGTGRDPNGMEALSIRITTGNGSLGSRSDGTDLVIDDLISNPDEDEAMVPPHRSGGNHHHTTRDRSLSGDQPIHIHPTSITNPRGQQRLQLQHPITEGGSSGGHAISNPLPIDNSRASAHHLRASIDEPSSSSHFPVNKEFSSSILPTKACEGTPATVSRPPGGTWSSSSSTSSAPLHVGTSQPSHVNSSDSKDLPSPPHSTVTASTTAPVYSKLHAALTQPRDLSTQSSVPVSQSNINCNRCGRELSSKCLMQTCAPTDETKCRNCGKELTTKCLLQMCLKSYPYN